MAEETLMLIVLVVLMLEKLKFVTVLGAGLLVGTALTVIIPEGIRSLYTDSVRSTMTKSQVNSVVSPGAAGLPVMQPNEQNHTHDSLPDDYSGTIGLSLVLGFVFMMLVDQVSQRQSASNDKNITATLGLVVHAAADGVALGAAATTSHQDVEMIVFLAIMLHKAPAAFGLVSFLLHEKIERQQIRKHLAIFSLSAPLLTLLTYFGIGQEQKETLNSVNATGIAMLFSAGTFLYVATVHVLPELTQSTGHHGSSGSSSSGGHHQYDNVAYSALENASNSDVSIVQKANSNSVHAAKGLRYSELFIMIFGALLPLVITFGHHH